MGKIKEDFRFRGGIKTVAARLLAKISGDYVGYQRIASKYTDKLTIPEIRRFLDVLYFEKMGRHLDLENPCSFNEKIQWLKIYDATPIKTRLADKYQVRDWVKEQIGEDYLVPIVGVWNQFDEINFDSLPDKFVLKANHASGYNIVVKDKRMLNLKEAKRLFDIWMETDFAFEVGFEMHYRDIPRKIIAEEYIDELSSDILDYRFFCFNGKPCYIWVDSGSGTQNHKRNIYDMNWNLLEYHVNYPSIDTTIDKPTNLDEMIKIVSKLCIGFSFVRVDLYNISGKIYFGEMTFTPQGGFGSWDDETINEKYGQLIRLPQCPYELLPAKQ